MYKIPWIKKVCLIKDELQQKQATLAQEFYSINSAISVYTLAAMNHIEAFASNRYFFLSILVFFVCFRDKKLHQTVKYIVPLPWKKEIVFTTLNSPWRQRPVVIWLYVYRKHAITDTNVTNLFETGEKT